MKNAVLELRQELVLGLGLGLVLELRQELVLELKVDKVRVGCERSVVRYRIKPASQFASQPASQPVSQCSV